MRVEVVTSFSPDGYALYGRACVRSFVHHWPFHLTAYVDAPMRVTGAVTTKLTRKIEGWTDVSRSLPFCHPRAEKPESYLWNAQRYAVKPFVWHAAAKKLSTGILVWLDADTITTADVPADLPEAMLGGADVAYLGRGAMHPENGCVVFRLPEAFPLLSWCRKAYEKRFYRHWKDGWTDCHALKHGLKAVRTRARDLTSDKHDGEWRSYIDAFALSPLGPYVIHLKGQRQKREGRLIPLDELKPTWIDRPDDE